jgi:hypothetical protein
MNQLRDAKHPINFCMSLSSLGKCILRIAFILRRLALIPHVDSSPSFSSLSPYLLLLRGIARELYLASILLGSLLGCLDYYKWSQTPLLIAHGVEGVLVGSGAGGPNMCGVR